MIFKHTEAKGKFIYNVKWSVKFNCQMQLLFIMFIGAEYLR